jgi:hypothetical protein
MLQHYCVLSAYKFERIREACSNCLTGDVRLTEICVFFLSFFSPKLNSPNLSDASENLCADYNFDCPDAVDERAMIECLDALRLGKPYEVPIYDFTTHTRSLTQSRRVEPAQVR